MDSMHAIYFKQVAAGGDLDAASEMALAKEAATLKADEIIVEKFNSEHTAPTDRVGIGTNFEMKVVLLSATQANMVSFFAGSETSSVYTKDQEVRTLAKHDVRLGVYRASDGLTILKDLTDVNIIPAWEESFEQGKFFYLPLTIQSTSTSTYSSDNSAT